MSTEPYEPKMCETCRVVHNTVKEHLVAHFDVATPMGKLLRVMADAIPDDIDYERVYQAVNEVSAETFKRGQKDVLDGGYAASQAAAAFRATWPATH